MAVLTAQGVSALALELLTRTLVLPRTVAQVPGTEFSGSNGDTITVRVRQPRDAKTQATPGSPIDFDDLSEVPVELTVEHLYDATRLTDEMLTLEIADFGAQVLQPMVATVAIGAEDQLAETMNDLAVSAEIEFAATASEDDTLAVVLAAREALGDNDVPIGDRYAAVSTDIASRFLALERVSRVDQSGSASALRDAIIGRLFGFTFVESNALDPGTAVFYHRSGFCWGNRAPVVPRGAAESAVSSNEGIALRTIFDYDVNTLSDRVAVSTFAGAAPVFEDTTGVDNARFVKVGTGT